MIIIGGLCVYSSYYEKDANGEIFSIDDELPFSIPDGWAWCALQDCCYKEIKRGRSPKYAEQGRVRSFAQKCNQKAGGINIGLALCVDDSSVDRYADDEYMRDGDIVINSTGTGTLGRIGIYHDSDNPSAIPIVPDSHVTVVRVSDYIDSSYAYFYLKAMQANLEEMGEGSTNQKELKPQTIQCIRLPLPPIAEQRAISMRVAEVFSYMDQIEEALL